MTIKISALPSPLAANIASTSVIPLVDATTTTTKATVGQLGSKVHSLMGVYSPIWPEFGAVFDGVTDDTAAIQACIDAAAAARGTVVLPAGSAVFSTLTYYKGSRIIGQGGGQFNGTASGTQLYQKAGTTDVCFKPALTTGQSNVYLADFLVSGINNTTNNTGGILLQGVTGSTVERVWGHRMNNFCFAVKGGTVDGDSMYNTFQNCYAYPNDGYACYRTIPNSPSFPDGTNVLNCWGTGAATSIFFKGDGTVPIRGAGGCQFLGNKSITLGIVADSWNANDHWIGNRFETTLGSLTVTLNSQGGGISDPAGTFIGNAFAFTTVFIWTDNGTTKATRIGNRKTGGGQDELDFPTSANLGIGTGSLPNIGAYISGATSGSTVHYGSLITPQVTSSATAAAIGAKAQLFTQASAFTVPDSYGFLVGDASKGAGSAITRQYGFYCSALTAGTNNYAFYAAGTNPSQFGGAVISGTATVTYSASMTPDASVGNVHVITATNGTAFTINAPTNPATGQLLRLRIRNTSGGALGVATFGGTFKMGAAWVQPATGFSRAIDFEYNGTNWVEASRSATDVTN